MRHSKIVILILATLLCAVLASTALAESTWGKLWTSGCDLLFNTHNVTVDGKAVFSLEGERFKTAELHYVQDGNRSLYDLKLLTPKSDGTDRETGWTIIAGEEGYYYVMEAYYPGTYREGSDSKQNTLLRRSIQLDALVDLGGIVINQLDTLLPEGVIAVNETEGAKTIHIAINGEQIPELAANALNLGANFLSDRWFGYSFDRSRDGEDGPNFGSYVTVTEALTDGTVRWALRNADVDFDLDSHDRLNSVHGNICMESTFHDGSVRAVTVAFELNMTEWGTSRVKQFDPEDYGVVPQWVDEDEYSEEAELDEAEIEKWIEKAKKVFAKQGYAVEEKAEYEVHGTEENGAFIVIFAPGGEARYCSFDAAGELMFLDYMSPIWGAVETQDVDSLDPALIGKAKDYIRSFLTDENPAFLERMGELSPQYQIETEDGSLYLALYDDEKSGALFVVCAAPDFRMEYFSIY